MCAFWRSIDIPVFRLIRWVTRMSCRRLVSSCDRRWADSSRCTTYRLICRRFMGRIQRECRSGCGCVFHLPRGSFGFLSEPTELGLFWVYGGFLGLHLVSPWVIPASKSFVCNKTWVIPTETHPPSPVCPAFPAFSPCVDTPLVLRMIFVMSKNGGGSVRDGPLGLRRRIAHKKRACPFLADRPFSDFSIQVWSRIFRAQAELYSAKCFVVSSKIKLEGL